MLTGFNYIKEILIYNHCIKIILDYTPSSISQTCSLIFHILFLIKTMFWQIKKPLSPSVALKAEPWICFRGCYLSRVLFINAAETMQHFSRLGEGMTALDSMDISCAFLIYLENMHNPIHIITLNIADLLKCYNSLCSIKRVDDKEWSR